ncbi:MAG: MBL fold metallo-hydrolase [Clostridium sp.]
MIKNINKVYKKESTKYTIEIYKVENSFQKEIEGVLVNTYIMIVDNKYGVIVDPGSDLTEVLIRPEFVNIEMKYILLTHFHVDHIAGLDNTKAKTNAKVAISEIDGKLLKNQEYTFTNIFGIDNPKTDIDISLKDQDIIEVTEFVKIKSHLTSGHTKGGMCFEVLTDVIPTEVLFTGDTMFNKTYGRVDFPSGNMQEMQASLRYIYENFNENTLILPGHDDIVILRDNKHLED